MARRFVLVEILDRDVRYLLSELRFIFNGRETSTPIHVTIRGPYPTAVSKELIESLEERLKKDVLLVAGVGTFKSSNRSVVFLRVASKRLRGVWWKPDFPAKTHGFQPHITLYEGANFALAGEIYEFLKSEKIELVCHEFQVVPHASGQFPSFYDSGDAPRGSASRLVAAGCVKEGILVRARRLVRKHGNQLQLLVESNGEDEEIESVRKRESLATAVAPGKH